MISSVRGAVLSVAGTTAVIEVGGVGFAVSVTPAHALTLRVGQDAMLRTALIVREDDLSLFGFATADELTVFDLLRGVTGVGPKSALGVLAAMTPDQIARAVSTDDDAAFRKVSGIGPKTAKLITLSLADKLTALSLSPSTAGASGAVAPASTTASVVAALVGLGWNERAAAQAIDEIALEAGDAELSSTQTLLRLALARLGQQPASSSR